MDDRIIKLSQNGDSETVQFQDLVQRHEATKLFTPSLDSLQTVLGNVVFVQLLDIVFVDSFENLLSFLLGVGARKAKICGAFHVEISADNRTKPVVLDTDERKSREHFGFFFNSFLCI
uniref:(northern house mosquito) hypothetical protein n=1 Tax=Culex pipiens TaxID=7175 RepID=A0A8D8NYG2_CULPI